MSVMSYYTPYVCKLVKETAKSKKITKNSDEKMTKFLQYLESSGKFRKKFSAKYIEVYILVLILWKTNRGVHSATLDKKNWGKPP